MSKTASFAAVRKLLFPKLRPDAAGDSRIRVFIDSNGDAWRRTYLPLVDDEIDEQQAQREAGLINLHTEQLPQEEFRSAEMRWLHDNQDRLAAIYSGQWIAIDGEELVAHASDLPTLLQLAREAGHPDPFITAIPAEPIIHLHV